VGTLLPTFAETRDDREKWSKRNGYQKKVYIRGPSGTFPGRRKAQGPMDGERRGAEGEKGRV